MNQKRLLVMDQYGSIGGGQTVFLNILEVALDGGNIVTALFPRGGDLEARIRGRFGDRIQMVHLHELELTRGKKTAADSFKMLFFSLYFLKFFPLIRSHQIIYVNGPRLFHAVYLASLLLRRRFIYHIHLVHGGKELHIVNKVLNGRNTSRVIVNSEFVRSQMEDHPKLTVVENALPPKFRDQRFVDRFNAAGNGFHVAVLGKIIPEKGQDIVPEIARRFPKDRFSIIGEDGDQKFAKALKRESPQNVSFLGRTKDVAGTIEKEKMQVSLVPSKWEEPFGLTAIESMACSCITITSGKGELSNIARRTSALTYDSLDGLSEILSRLHAMPSPELSSLASEQFRRTQESYGFETFRMRILEILHAEANQI